MPKNVENGVLQALSPSMISAFDADSSFGCERRGYYKYVMGFEEPPSGNQQLGTDLHALIERRLLEKATPEATGEAAGLYLAGQTMIERVASLNILGIEQPLKPFFLDGVPVKGYVDVVHEHGIIDWKTSSDIRRYGKTAEQLATDTQMVIYGRAMHPNLPTVRLAHGQFQTRGAKRTDFVEVEVTRNHLDSHIEKVIIPKVRRIKEVVALPRPEDVPGDASKCGRCPFNVRCTLKGDAVMSFFQKLKSAPVVPPDAPASDPALAAKPVEGFSPVPPPRTEHADVRTFPKEEVAVVAVDPRLPNVEEPAPRRRGRPPGSKNKPKMTIVDVSSDEPNPPIGTTPVEPAVVTVQSKVEDVKVGTPVKTDPATREGASVVVKFKTITVTKGATVNLGDYNSARFESSVTVECEDYATGYAAALQKVDEALDAEVSKFQAMKGGK